MYHTITTPKPFDFIISVMASIITVIQNFNFAVNILVMVKNRQYRMYHTVTTPSPQKNFHDFIIFYEKTSAISSFATSVIFRSFSVIFAFCHFFLNVFAENQFLAQLFKILKNFKISFSNFRKIEENFEKLFFSQMAFLKLGHEHVLEHVSSWHRQL